VKAVIFSAGLGTRLYPFTKDKPKALVEVGGIAMLEHTLRKIKSCGIQDVIINVHAFADKVKFFLKEYAIANPDMYIRISDERAKLLDTGGGLKKMQPLLSNDTFIAHNVDILSTIDLKELQSIDYKYHEIYPLHIATLVVRKTDSDRYFLFNEEGILSGWENVITGEQKISRPNEKRLFRFGFTGIHIIHPELFPLMTEKGVFSITDVYLRLARNYEIRMLDASQSLWFDIGNPEQLQLAEQSWILHD
jgi:NDP-sugar pyrophosphorylase family protein